jgi:prepilin-type N-terminal cleavage/methylation domain-containing protein
LAFFWNDTMHFFSKPSIQRGMTMVEILLVFAIVLVLAALSFMQFSVRNRDVMVNHLISDHFALVDGVRSIGAGRSDYFIAGNDWETALKNANALPQGMSTGAGAGNLKHALGGAVTLTPLQFQGPASGNTWPGLSLIQVTYSNLERSACLRLANAVAAASYDTQVNGTRVHLLNPPALDTVDVAQLTGLCANNNTNVVLVQQTQNMDIINYTMGDVATATQTILYPKAAALRAQKAGWH